MPGRWHMHDAGLIQLELPHGWIADQPSAGTLLLEDPETGISTSVMVVHKENESPDQAGAPPDARDVQTELQRWVDGQRHVQMRESPRVVLAAGHATATIEGMQPARRTGKWYKRLLQWRGTATMWRFWAVLNSHLLVLVSSSGRAEQVERQRGVLDRMIASIQLPQREILTGRRFTEMVVSLARTWFPETAVAVIDDAHLQFGPLHISLDRLHRRYLASPDELPMQVRALLRQMQKEMPAGVVTLSWREAKEHVMPVFLRQEILSREKGRVLNDEWVNDLRMAYAVESPDDSTGGQRLVTLDDLLHWGIDAEDLHAQSLQNLMARSHEQVMEGRREDGYTMLALARADQHNAVRVLLPELHHKLREHLGTTFYAAMPTRGTLRAFNTRDAATLKRIRAEVAREFAASGQGLSKQLFLVTPDGIAGDPADAF